MNPPPPVLRAGPLALVTTIVALFLASWSGSVATAGSTTTWHVAPDGDDAGDGSAAAPFASLQAAFDAAGAGDVIRLGAGAHGALGATGVGGTAQAPIRVTADAGATVHAPAGTALWVDDVHHVTFDRLRVTAGTLGVDVHRSGDVVLSGLTVSDTAGAALSVDASSDITIEGCTIDRADPGIAVGEGGDGSGALGVRGCTIDATRTAAIRVGAGAGEVTIAANTIRSVDGHGVVLRGAATVVNNVLVGVDGHGVRLDAMPADRLAATRVLHNTLFEIGGSPLANAGGGSPTVRNNLGIDAPGNRPASPADFVDATGGDLQLAPTSPAVDSGSSSTVATDIDGRARPQGDAPDHGAHELAASEIPTPATTTTVPGPVVSPEVAEAPGTTVDASEIPTALGPATDVERAGTGAEPPTVSLETPGTGTGLAAGSGASGDGTDAPTVADRATRPVPSTPDGDTAMARHIDADGVDPTAPIGTVAGIIVAGGVVGYVVARSRSRDRDIAPEGVEVTREH